MKILAVDTTTNHGGVGLGIDGKLEAAIFLPTPQSYAETMIPMTEFLLSQLRIGLKEIDYLAVTTGPGSFTGVRIGLALIKAIGQSREIPGIGVSTLEAIAYSFQDLTKACAPILDARRNQVYGAVYTWNNGDAEQIGKETVMEAKTWIEKIPKVIDPLFVGSGTVTHKSLINKLRPKSIIITEPGPLLSGLVRLSTNRIRTAVSVTKIEANYIRASDAMRG